jgi:3',5'-cyclic AMP phosphodiesterase CpdA
MAPEPILQLIHVSDLHFATGADQAQAQRVGAMSRFASLPWFAGGMMGHDAAALDQFEDALSFVLAERIFGSGRPPSDPGATARVKAVSWVVCTGDLSTFGDKHGQVTAALRWLAGVASRKGIRYCSIYGNHDVWDCAVPWDSTESALVARRDQLRRTHFPTTFPLVPAGVSAGGSSTKGLRVRLPKSGRTLMVTSLNTVLHERFQNTFAYGEVKEDYYWRQQGIGPDQNVELLFRAQPDEIRVVLTHHPVHFDRTPFFGMRILNDMDVAVQLTTRVGATGGATGAPLATLVLSGHTHTTFPPMPGLPQQLPQTPAQAHVPLGTGQLQLVVGTLSQRALAGSPRTHDFTCLRFFEDDHGVLALEREVWRRSRPGPSGPFRPIGDRHGWTEPLVLG